MSEKWQAHNREHPDYKASFEHVKAALESSEAARAKLRDALEKIAAGNPGTNDHWLWGIEMSRIARAALEADAQSEPIDPDIEAFRKAGKP